MNVKALLERVRSWLSPELELEPLELSDDDALSVLVDCFGVGKAHFTMEASYQEQVGNKAAERRLVAKADLADRLYELAREEMGKTKDATPDELRSRPAPGR